VVGEGSVGECVRGRGRECVQRDNGRSVSVPRQTDEEDTEEDVDESGEPDLLQRLLEVIGAGAPLFLRQRRREVILPRGVRFGRRLRKGALWRSALLDSSAAAS